MERGGRARGRKKGGEGIRNKEGKMNEPLLIKFQPQYAKLSLQKFDVTWIGNWNWIDAARACWCCGAAAARRADSAAMSVREEGEVA